MPNENKCPMFIYLSNKILKITRPKDIWISVYWNKPNRNKVQDDFAQTGIRDKEFKIIGTRYITST